MLFRSQRLHPYIYVKNNPVNWIDPKGEIGIVEGIIGGIIIGGIIYETVKFYKLAEEGYFEGKDFEDCKLSCRYKMHCENKNSRLAAIDCWLGCMFMMAWKGGGLEFQLRQE
ncbi:MAG: hypothetical protein AB1630_07970 [bacterium]